MKTNGIKPNAIIVDIDGTVADLTHRLHYVETKPANWEAFKSLVSQDKPIIPVITIVQALAENHYDLIFVSGREGTDECHADTFEWLFKYFTDFKLYMRKEKDYRADDIIKKEIFEEYIKPYYNVVAVFDDRPRVVKMWREQGLFVFDVNQTGRDF